MDAMSTTRLLATVAAVGSVEKHISGGYRLAAQVIPVMRSSRQPSTLYQGS